MYEDLSSDSSSSSSSNERRSKSKSSRKKTESVTGFLVGKQLREIIERIEKIELRLSIIESKEGQDHEPGVDEKPEMNILTN